MCVCVYVCVCEGLTKGATNRSKVKEIDAERVNRGFKKQ
jgi:hypothetical protein